VLGTGSGTIGGGGSGSNPLYPNTVFDANSGITSNGTVSSTGQTSTASNVNPTITNTGQSGSGGTGVLAWIQNHVESVFIVLLGVIVVAGSLFLFGADAITPPIPGARIVRKAFT
jgi:hypothetical protein